MYITSHFRELDFREQDRVTESEDLTFNLILRDMINSLILGPAPDFSLTHTAPCDCVALY